MFERKYYYLVSGLSNVLFDSNKNLVDFSEFVEQMREMLHKDDYKLVEFFLSETDIENLINLLVANGKEFKRSGNYSEDQMSEFVKFPDDAPAYMQNAIFGYKNKEYANEFELERQLSLDFYKMVKCSKKEFISNWFNFQLNIKNIVTAINCREFELDLESQIMGTNELAEQVLKNKSKDFGLSKLFPEIDTILKAFDQDNLINQERMIDSIVWEKAGELSAMNNFSIENILTFLIRLKVAYRWKNLESAEGEEIFRELIGKLQESYELGEEFQ
jgi:hypothetical protein